MERRKTSRLVVVDSSRKVLRVLKCVLEEKDEVESCTCFRTAQDALQYIQSGPRIDVLIVDCMLGDMDILRFMRMINRKMPDHKFKIIVTGPTEYDGFVRTKLLSIGMHYYMIKPYTADDLLDSVDMVQIKGGLARITRWDGYLIRQLEKRKIPQKQSGFWCVGNCLQCWLMATGQPPQLKEIYLDVGKKMGISAKGIESGVHRVALLLYELKAFDKVLSNRDLIETLANSICLEIEQEGQELANAGENK